MDLSKFTDFFKDIPGKLQKLKSWMIALPKDEKIAYSTILAGLMLMMTSFFFW